MNRRRFIKTTLAVGVTTTAFSAVGMHNARDITSAVRRDETIVRLGGDAATSAMTWAADGRQLVAICDSAGWPQKPKERYWTSRLFACANNPQNAIFSEVSGYPDIPVWDFLQGAPPYYGTSLLAVDGHIYQFLATFDRIYNVTETYSDTAPFTMTNTKLIHSPDNGLTWFNQNGTTPVTRELQHEQSRSTMTFFQEDPKGAFSYLSFLQMGQDYRDNRDGYVYIYSPNGAAEGTMNELVMFRVPKGRILDRRAYEYFAGTRADGDAHWVKDIHARGIVHSFASGWVPKVAPWSWTPSIVFNEPLGVYMMASSGGCSVDCILPNPTYLGLWVASKPWGPWRQIHEEIAWKPGNDSAARPVWPQIAPKWVAEDGKSFWLVWTDFQHTSDFQPSNLDETFRARSESEVTRLRSQWRKWYPYFAFNTQRVDLRLA